MEQPIDTTTIKNLLISNGMKDYDWESIERFIEETQQISQSVIFFILDPYEALKIIPRSWTNMFPTGFLEFLDNLNNKLNLDKDQKAGLFRRTAYYNIEGLYQILLHDVHIDDFLTYIPDIFLDILMNNPNEIDKIIEQCKKNKQDDSIGYTKLLLLK